MFVGGRGAEEGVVKLVLMTGARTGPSGGYTNGWVAMACERK